MSLRMESSGSPEIAAVRPAVWRRITDPHFVAQSAPGFQVVRELGLGHSQIESTVGIGPVRLPLTINLEISHLAEPDSARLSATTAAHDSTVHVVSMIRLEEIEPGRTVMHWHTTTDIDGILANLGPKLAEGVVRKFTTDFWEDFARRVSADTPS